VSGLAVPHSDVQGFREKKNGVRLRTIGRQDTSREHGLTLLDLLAAATILSVLTLMAFPLARLTVSRDDLRRLRLQHPTDCQEDVQETGNALWIEQRYGLAALLEVSLGTVLLQTSSPLKKTVETNA